MNPVIALDISSFIWDEADYNDNMDHYYKLSREIFFLIKKLELEKPVVLLRNELILQLINGFPFFKLPKQYWEIQNMILLFLANTGSNIMTYPDNIITGIDSYPKQIKLHFNNTLTNEIYYLLSKMHTDATNISFFTFEYLWSGGKHLKTIIPGETKKHECIVSDRGNELNDYFNKYKPIFRHNPKHRNSKYYTKEMYEKGVCKDKFISPLSTNVPQELLDTGFKCGEKFYNFDNVNDVYIVFRNTRMNEYHGYDEYDHNNIPNEVKKQFNKW